MAAKKNPPMCCLIIDHHKILVPADAGLKIVALLRDAFELQYDFENGGGCSRYFTVGDPVSVEFMSLHPGQVRVKPGDDAGLDRHPAPLPALPMPQRKLGHDR